MDPIKKTARITGLLYLLVGILGPFAIIYMPGQLFASADATATVNYITTHESLFRAYLAAGIMGELLFIGVVLGLYRLLKGVHPELAALMVILILVDAPLAFSSTANELATLAFVRDADFLAVFDKPQRDALTTLLIHFNRKGILVSEVFWGLWLLPLGFLVYRSSLLPRFLGVWLFLNGAAYLVLSLTGILSPEYHAIVDKIAKPFLFGELALMLWLLFVGARVRPSPAPAPQSPITPAP